MSVGGPGDLNPPHDPKVAGSNPAPATNDDTGLAITSLAPLSSLELTCPETCPNAEGCLVLQPPTLLKAEEYRGEKLSGETRPLLIGARTSDGKTAVEVILKLRRPDSGIHFEGTSLACALICAVLARALGLPVEDYAIVEVTKVPGCPSLVSGSAECSCGRVAGAGSSSCSASFCP